MGLPRLAFALSLVTVLFALDHVYPEEDSSRHLSESYSSSSDSSTSSYDSSTTSSYSSSSDDDDAPSCDFGPCWVDGRSKGLFIAWILVLILGISCTVGVAAATEGSGAIVAGPICCCLFLALVIAWRVTAGGDDDDDSYSSSSDYDSSSYDSTTSAPTTAWSSSDTSSSTDVSCLLYTSPSPRDGLLSRMPSSA